MTLLGRTLAALAFAAAVSSCLIPATVAAQRLELSAAQRQMINALPPSQRQQALALIDRLQSQPQATAQSTLNEPLPSMGGNAIDQRTNSQVDDLIQLTAQPQSRLIVTFTPLERLSTSQNIEIEQDPVLSKLSGSHHYILSKSGVLSIRGLASIPVLGLESTDIERRLLAESKLSWFDIDVRILQQELIGIEALQPFGYEVFAQRDSSFGAPASGPVPADYVLGPGDSLRVQLFGKTNLILENEISREGLLNLDQLGPVNVAGMTFSEFRRDLSKRVSETLIGTQVSVSMGQLRTIRVFVFGDVNQPGSYVVSGLSTISSVLYSSGGVSPVGSLRDIQLKRNGRVVASLDTYDLLIRGDTSGDVRLRPGDAIFVPPIGKTVSIYGAVNRPAIYEVRRLTTAADLVALIGGLKPEADPTRTRLERIGAEGDRTVVAVDLDSPSANTVRIQKGDALFVPEVLPEFSNVVVVAGHVYRPGVHEWRAGMQLSDLIESSAELKSGVDMDYILVRRERVRGQAIEVLSTSLAEALAAPGGSGDIVLQPGDTVHVFGLGLGRQRFVSPMLEELRSQATIDHPYRQIEVSGNVRAPGVYPLEPGMRVSDLIRAGGNLSENAYALEAELTRYSISPAGGRESSVKKVNLQAIRRGDESADFLLQEHDYLIVKRVPEWDTIWTVTLEGEVVFPGEYRVSRGETLAQVVQRAGGLTAAAFADGAVFLREALKDREQEQIDTLARRMESDLAALSLQTAEIGGSETFATGSVLLDQLRETEAIGRLVIDLAKEASSSAGAIELRNGDRLLVPTKTQVVTVLGEVQQNTSHLFAPGMTRQDYIDLSGGLTRRADKKLIYVVRASGAVNTDGRSRWFARRQGADIRPGDTIVVPLDTDRIRPLTFWGNVTQILYQGAIAVAAVQTFNN